MPQFRDKNEILDDIRKHATSIVSLLQENPEVNESLLFSIERDVERLFSLKEGLWNVLITAESKIVFETEES